MKRHKRLGAGVLIALLVIAFHREVSWEFSYWGIPTESPAPPSLHLPSCAGCNVVLLSMDTLRADFAADMPHLKLIAEESVEFVNAYTNAFYTTPSHMTLFTSLYPGRHQVTGRGVHVPRWPRSSENSSSLPANYQTLAEILQSSGYRTQWYAPLNLKHLDRELGFGRGFEKFSPTLFARPGRPKMALNTAAWAHALEQPKPFFYFVHSYATHLPYFIPDGGDFPLLFGQSSLINNYYHNTQRSAALPKACSEERGVFGCLSEASLADSFLHDLGQFQLWAMEKIFSGKRAQKKIPQQKKSLREAYGSSVKLFDDQLAEWWRVFKASGRAADTLVVLFSDHGEELFEHGHGSHSSFYQHTARIPVILFHPKLKDPIKAGGLMSLVDVMPTLLSVLELDPSPQAQGRNLNGMAPSKPVFGSAMGTSYVFDGRWKLTQSLNGDDELFFLPLDPGEKSNLANLRWPRTAGALHRLREARRRWQLEQAL